MATHPAKQPPHEDFEGRVAVVTGSASGIGRATALAFADCGAAVIVADRDRAGAERVSTEVKDTGGIASVVAQDLGDPEAVAELAETAQHRFGRLDYLFANAAIHRFGKLLDTTPEDWEMMLRATLTSVFLSIRACLPMIRASGNGAIVATASDCAIRTCSDSAAYVTAKSGVIGLIRSVAVDYGPDIRANVVIPGVTDTPGLRHSYSLGGRTPDSGLQAAASLSPLGRVADPTDIAAAVIFLCSPKAGFITGASLVVDGGMTITYGAD